jgi:hypothetical protein
MSLEYVTVEINGDTEQAMALIRSLPGGEHDPEPHGANRYIVATTNAGFLCFAMENQGYGTVVERHVVTE